MPRMETHLASAPVRFFASSHAPIDFYFKKCPKDFVVSEEPLYPFSGEGAHGILHVRKKNKSTWEMLSFLANVLGCPLSAFGYAGLKDKDALTSQYISLPKEYLSTLESHAQTLQDHNIKILDTTCHSHKIRLGHLKGNRFFMRLKKVTPLNAQKISHVLEFLTQWGFPNYFGAQRFGKWGDNFKQAKLQTSKKPKKLDRFLISSYQSWLFNHWLSMRMQLSTLLDHFSPKEVHGQFAMISLEQIKALQDQEHYFKLLEGDVLCHYPFGKYFYHQEGTPNAERFARQELAPTGLLPGLKVWHAQGLSSHFEALHDLNIQALGDRRYAVVFPTQLEFCYLEKQAQATLSFFLPKGSYATTFLEEIAHLELFKRGNDDLPASD
ncbi:tRNA pseudouridine(13) synthase TruD [Helicobacter bizzozeronii]|uniref:tRNA pseudouridine synthase D n=1 Tax=Helicobacter bizzozeronii (strain CIII-1) TaxID=1002804 RepID=F8KRC5_HELBC|nr:tRNA pseudouridine(13) synthase TruD [Helicobacter bizzozeronii]CCB79299.1 tRNA pseudouridine 13 synthase [Helicobacter bizzozeronii CIII-1]